MKNKKNKGIVLTKVLQIFDCNGHEKLTQNALLFLQEWGLIPREGTYFCPEGHDLKLEQDSDHVDGFVWRCWQETKGENPKKCDVTISLRKNTFFSKTELPIYKPITFTYFWLYDWLHNVVNELQLSSHTADEWNTFCCELAYDGMILKKDKIGGPGVVVELDEYKCGRRIYHREYRIEEQWVVGGVEKGSKKCFLLPVEQRDKETLLEIIKEWILPNTTIVSNFWKTYNCLPDEDYNNLRINHSLHFMDPDTKKYRNTIERLLRYARYSMPQYHKNKKCFYGYLAKISFMKNVRITKTDALVKFFEMVGHLYDPRSPHFVEEGKEEEDDDFEVKVERKFAHPLPFCYAFNQNND